MADIEELIGTESPFEVGQKINEIIENKADKATTYTKTEVDAALDEVDTKLAEKVNLDLSNLSTTGQNIIENKANVDLDNLSETGEKHFLNKTQITNCILPIEELVKVETSSSSAMLTLKKGSIVYVSTNGTFNEITISSDISAGSGNLFTTDGRRDLYACYVPSINEIKNISVAQTYSQATAPTTDTMLNSTYCGWFDTTNNVMKYTYDGGSTWTICSLPFALGNPVSGDVGWYQHIKQVFNGFGVVGQHTFTTRGVKALLPNGRNADGTLNNKETSSTSLKFTDETGKSSVICFFDGKQIITYGVSNYFEQDEAPTFAGTSAQWLNTKENVMYSTSDGGTTWAVVSRCYLGKLVKNSSTANITEFEPNKPVELVKRVEFEKISTEVENLTNNKIQVDNSSMVVSSAGVLCKLGERNFYKRNDGWAICALVYFTNGYGGPILIGKTPESVKQYNDYNTTDSTIGGSFFYKGITYYYSANESSMPITSSIYKPYSYPIFTNRSESALDMAKGILLQYYSSTNFSAPVNSYLDDMLWYDVWGNGKIECGGIYEGATIGKEFAITFPINISKVLNIQFSNYAEGVDSSFYDGINIKSISSTGFVAFIGSIANGSAQPSKIMWKVNGYK